MLAAVLALQGDTLAAADLKPSWGEDRPVAIIDAKIPRFHQKLFWVPQRRDLQLGVRRFDIFQQCTFFFQRIDAACFDRLGALDWDKTAAPSDAPSSPESVEFVINDHLRVQIWKSPRLAVIRNGGEEHWFKTAYGDYTEAVEMVLNYSLTQSEREARLEAAEEEPSISTSAI